MRDVAGVEGPGVEQFQVDPADRLSEERGAASEDDRIHHDLQFVEEPQEPGIELV